MTTLLATDDCSGCDISCALCSCYSEHILALRLSFVFAAQKPLVAAEDQLGVNYCVCLVKCTLTKNEKRQWKVIHFVCVVEVNCHWFWQESAFFSWKFSCDLMFLYVLAPISIFQAPHNICYCRFTDIHHRQGGTALGWAAWNTSIMIIVIILIIKQYQITMGNYRMTLGVIQAVSPISSSRTPQNKRLNI